jgi:hypothetical protein
MYCGTRDLFITYQIPVDILFVVSPQGNITTSEEKPEM